MAALETDVTAVDVAKDFVATKIAIVQVFENLCGTSPAVRELSVEEAALGKWTHDSPVPLGDDLEPVWERANEITEQIMRAIGAYFIECA
jgi:hypothetical protein